MIEERALYALEGARDFAGLRLGNGDPDKDFINDNAKERHFVDWPEEWKDGVPASADIPFTDFYAFFPKDLVNMPEGGMFTHPFTAGDDLRIGGEIDERIIGEDGNDTLKGREGNDLLHGGERNDVFYGDLGNDSLAGGLDNDTLCGGKGRDILFGGSGYDRLHGGAGADVLRGNNGDDTLLGGRGNDTLMGGWNNDALYGGTGNDQLYAALLVRQTRPSSRKRAKASQRPFSPIM